MDKFSQRDLGGLKAAYLFSDSAFSRDRQE
jgi:hypothetical protein